MVRHHISDELKEVALLMSLRGYPDLEICGLTGISEQSLRRLRSTHRNTGAVSHTSPGRFRMLTAMEAKVRRTIKPSLELDFHLTGYSSLFVIVSPASPTLPSRNSRQSSEKSSTLRHHCRRYYALYNRLGIPGRWYVAVHLFNLTISVLYIGHAGCSRAK